jgi:hypothetical protein
VDQPGQLVTQQRLAPGDADLLYTELDEEPCQALDLLKINELQGSGDASLRHVVS